MEDRGQVLWIGTYSGVSTWNTGSGFFSHYKKGQRAGNQPSGNVVFSIAGREDDVWIATYGNGLNHFDRKTGEFTHYNADPADPDSIADDRVDVTRSGSARRALGRNIQ